MINNNNLTGIRGKVAKILNTRELVINKGSNDGVKIGMKFDVFDPKGENIIDPDSKEVLGSVLRPKVKVEIVSVQEKVSIASTYKKKTYNVGGTATFNLSSLALALRPPEWVTEYETLKTKESTWEDLEEEDSFVKTGDSVIEIIESKEKIIEKEKEPGVVGYLSDEEYKKIIDERKPHKRTFDQDLMDQIVEDSGYSIEIKKEKKDN